MTTQKYGTITGNIVMIGFGSIGRGTLPLIERHFNYDPKKFIVIDPDATHRKILDDRGIQFIQAAVTEDNYKTLLQPLLQANGGQSFCVNLSVDTSSLDIMKLCRAENALYIDTVVEPWLGFYFDDTLHNADRTNYALRETVRAEKLKNPGGPTAVSCCGANPGMVSWLVKAALLNMAQDLNLLVANPQTRAEWAGLMQQLGVKGIHIAERDTQFTAQAKLPQTFVNTWSIDGFLSEGNQPAELGWGTHERWKPANSNEFQTGCRAAIFLDQPGADTRVRTWCPSRGAQFGFLVTHNEAISIADYYTIGNPAKPQYRPTCHYAYHPCDDAVTSLHELFGSNQLPNKHVLLDAADIVDGADELGVLLYGHAKGAYWYGSHLTIAEARKLAPFQNATGLQVTSSVLAGMVWALENPNAGIVETDEMDHARCLAVQTPYLGTVKGYYTDWTPLSGRPGLFPEDIDAADPWQFRNILVHSR